MQSELWERFSFHFSLIADRFREEWRNEKVKERLQNGLCKKDISFNIIIP